VNPALALDEYFERVVNLFARPGVARLAETRAVAFEGASDGVLRLDAEYRGVRISIELDADVSYGYADWRGYSFHVQRSDGTSLFRYDNSPHHRQLETFPDHKHVGPDERVEPAAAIHPPRGC
jgi:hypothetical protein